MTGKAVKSITKTSAKAATPRKIVRKEVSADVSSNVKNVCPGCNSPNCRCGHKKFFAWLVFLGGLVWLLSELGVINVNVPWLPLLVTILGLSWILK